MFGFNFLNLVEARLEVKVGTEIVQAQTITAPLTSVMTTFANIVKELAAASTPGKVTVTNLADNSQLTFATEAYLNNFDIDD